MTRSFRGLFACLLALGAFAAQPVAAAGVRGDIVASVSGVFTGSNDLGSVRFSLDQKALLQVAPGTGSGKADKLFSDQRTIAASGSEDLDLAGVLADPVGGTLTFVHVKAIYIKAAAANTNSVVVGAGTNPFSGPLGGTAPTVTIPPGGAVLLTHPGAGWAVTASTGDILHVANSSSGTGVTYDVVIVGTSN